MFQPSRLNHLLVSPVEKREAFTPFSLESLIAWLETMGVYCYVSAGECLWGRYTTAHGGYRCEGCEAGYQIGSTHFPNDFHFRMTDHRYDLAVHYPHTFGAALTRARQYAEKVGGGI